jgi:uncharacterized protein (TIGR03067 family)
MSARALLLPAVVLSLAFAPAPFPKPRRGDPAPDARQIQGTWQLLSRTCGGEQVSHVVATAQISAGRLVLMDSKGDWRSPFTLTLDPTKKPRWFDTKSEGSSTYTTSGLYDLQGDDLRLVYTTQGKGRPSSLDQNAPGVYVDVYRRKR